MEKVNQLEGKIFAELEQLRSKMKLMQDELFKIDDLDAIKAAAVDSKNVLIQNLKSIEKSHSQGNTPVRARFTQIPRAKLC